MVMPAQSQGGAVVSVEILGQIEAVKARIVLHRSFDHVWHSYKGYVLVLDDAPKVALGPTTHAKHRFRIGDVISGVGEPVPDERTEWADIYKVRRIKFATRGPESEDRAADIDGGICPPLEELREHGHLRLDPRTYERSCTRCPFGVVLPTEIILDQWNTSRVKWRFETHCYGPRDCPRYRPGAPRRVPGRSPGMVYVDDDVERLKEDEEWAENR